MVYFSKGDPAGRRYISPSERCGEEHQAVSQDDKLKARGAGRFAIKRADHIIEGYQKTHLKEVLKDYIDGWSGMMTKHEAAL